MTGRFALALALPLALAACGGGSDASDSAATDSVATGEELDTALEAAVADSVEGWNTGDIDRFLALYSDSPEATFVGSQGVMRGVGEIEEAYRGAYDWSRADTAERGELGIQSLGIRQLGDDHALYIGRYTLTFDGEREPATGPTSLVFAREDEGWRVIADHSS